MIIRPSGPYVLPVGANMRPLLGIGPTRGLAYLWVSKFSGATAYYGQGRGGNAGIVGLRNAVYNSITTISEGKFGPSPLWTGSSNQRLELSANLGTGTDSAILQSMGQHWTVMLWFRLDALGSARTLYGERRTDTNHVLNFYTAAANLLNADFIIDGAAGIQSMIGVTTLVASRWYHGALTSAPSTYPAPGARLYLDGKLETTNTSALLFSTAGDRSAVGALPTTSGNGFQFLIFSGMIDMIAIFDRALNAGEIAAHYGNPALLFTPERIYLPAFPPDISATGAFTLGALTVAGVSTVTNPRTATGAFTLGALTVSSSATVVAPVTSTGAFTLGALTVSSSATVVAPVTSTGAFTLGALTIDGVATETNIVAGAFTLGALTIAGTTTSVDPVTGTGAFTLGALTTSGSASVTNPVIGTSAFTLGALTISSTVLVTEDHINVSGNFTLGALTIASVVDVLAERTIIGNLHLGSLLISGHAVNFAPVTGAAHFTLGSLTIASTALTTNPGGLQDYPDGVPAPLLEYRDRLIPRVMQTIMSSGRLRSRRRYVGMLLLMDFTWNLTEDQYAIFERWFETTLGNGVNPWSLVTKELQDDPHFYHVITRRCAFLAPYSVAHGESLYSVTASVEVQLLVDEGIDHENPHNPAVTPEAPELHHDFDDYPCRETFRIKADHLEEGKAYTIEISESHDGPWRAHVFLRGPETGAIEYLFNNDYRGLSWFRLKRNHDGKVMGRPTHPAASVVSPPSIAITGLIAPMAALWSDYAYRNGTASNPRISRTPYFIVPRERFAYSSGPSTDPDPTPRIITVTNDTEGTYSTWTNDNSEPQPDTDHPHWDGAAQNIGVAHFDFGYAIRARSFIPDGCVSPITLVLVDKLLWMKPWTTAIGEGGDAVDSCDISYFAGVRTDWARDPETHEFVNPLTSYKFVSGDNCDAVDELGGLLTALIQDTRSDYGVLSRRYVFQRHGTQAIYLGRSFLGTGDGGDHYIGWDTEFAVTDTFHATSISLERYAPMWDKFPPCYSNCCLSLQGELFDIDAVGDYLTNSSFDGLTGVGGTAEAIIDSMDQPVTEFVEPLAGSNTIGSNYYNFWVYLTLHNDYVPPAPLLDLPPAPVIPPTPLPADPTFGDDFELYASTATAELATLAEGSGWDVASDWVIQNIVQLAGYDMFETYDVGTISTTLSGGEGWDGAWTFSGSQNTFGTEDFEYYPVKTTDRFALAGGGTNWDGAWTLGYDLQHIYGSDGFESETVGVVNDPLHAMEHGPGWDIYWTIEDSLQVYGEDSFASYATGVFASGSGGSNWTGSWTIEDI